MPPGPRAAFLRLRAHCARSTQIPPPKPPAAPTRRNKCSAIPAKRPAPDRETPRRTARYCPDRRRQVRRPAFAARTSPTRTLRQQQMTIRPFRAGTPRQSAHRSWPPAEPRRPGLRRTTSDTQTRLARQNDRQEHPSESEPATPTGPGRRPATPLVLRKGAAPAGIAAQTR